jgi:hypothetical protein
VTLGEGGVVELKYATRDGVALRLLWQHSVTVELKCDAKRCRASELM